LGKLTFDSWNWQLCLAQAQFDEVRLAVVFEHMVRFERCAAD
jgi:hypothetical protein